jgi:hypothetical protein
VGQIVVDFSGLDPLPDAEGVREAASTLYGKTLSFRAAVDQAKGDWAPVDSVISSDSLDLEPFYAGFEPLASAVDEVRDRQRGFRDRCHALADGIDDVRQRRDMLRNTTIPARQRRLDAAIVALDEASVPAAQSLTGRATLEMQGIADRIRDDWADYQHGFINASLADAPVAPRDYPRFEYGTRSARSSEGHELFSAASVENATPEQVRAWYDHLAELSPEELAALAVLAPRMRTTPPPLPQSPGALAARPRGDHGGAWWGGLSRDQQQALIAYLPATVGNTEGIPYSVRDQANRNTLDLVLYGGLPWTSNHETYRQIQQSLTSAGPGRGERYLLSFDPNDRPLAAVSVGNVDAADNVTVMVSGMTSGTHNMSGEAGHAQNVFDGQIAHDPFGNNAVVSWIGYDSPDYLTVFSDGDAERGAVALSGFLDGIHETRSRAGEPPQVNVMAHSYGTNTSATALTLTEHPVDHYIMYGSAGLDKDHLANASDLNVARDEGGAVQVYATDAELDPLSGIGRWGSWFSRIDPTDDDFGAIEFSSDGGGNVPGHPVGDHGQYLDAQDAWGYVEPGSQAFNSIIMIVEGEGGRISPVRADGDGTMILAPGPPGHPDVAAYGGRGARA